MLMGLIYSITKKFLPAPWRGLRPTSLDELIGRTEILWGQEIDLLNLRIVPAIIGPSGDAATLIQQSPYGLDFLATYSNGKQLHIVEPLPAKEGNGHTIVTAKNLLDYAETVQKKLLNNYGYKTVVVYRPFDEEGLPYQPPESESSHPDYLK